MGKSTAGAVAPRRTLLGLGGIGALLGLVAGARTARAADGDPLIASGETLAASRTELNVTPGEDQIAFYVRRSNRSNAIEARGGGPHMVGAWFGPGTWAAGGDNTSTGDGGDGALGRAVGDATGRYPVGGVYLKGSECATRSGAGLDARGGASGTGRGGAGVTATGGRPADSQGIAGDGVYADARTPGDQLDAPGEVAAYGEGGGQNGVKGPGIDAITSSTANAGVVGTNVGSGPGVLGRSLAADGVTGGTGIGVRGSSGSGVAGRFESQAQAGVRGSSQSGRGLQGSGSPGPGITALTTTNHGVSGTSTNGTGVAGFSTNGLGGYFEARTLEQPAMRARNNQAAGDAGNGALGLLVNGSFVVEHGAKSAAVPTSQGRTRLYCVEAPISVFEDVGTARLAAGQVRVDLDPVFAATIQTGDYYVFLTPLSPASKGLAVVTQDSRGFVVQETGGGTGSYDLDYRVVARRRGLPASHRLAPFKAAQPPASATPGRPGPLPLPIDPHPFRPEAPPTEWPPPVQ